MHVCAALVLCHFSVSQFTVLYLLADEVHGAESLAMDNTIASAAEVTEHMTEEPDSNTADMTDRPDSLPTVTEDEAYVIVNKNE